ncbi:MAG: hypothetical protein FWH40_05110 [Coriobacteriia bacterium]|nr:hypothetical protein [Coriobacteriia bacterium]
MPTLSPHENYKRMLNGEIPEYVPTMMDATPPNGPVQLSFRDALLPMVGGWDPGEVHHDLFGVPYVTERNANLGALPQPGVFILDDITKWRDVIKRPAALDEIDWEYCASIDLPKRDPDALFSGGPSIGNGYFQMLNSFMGFDMGLMACAEEPDEVKDLMSFLVDLNVEMAKKFIYYYKPDAYGMGDDIAHERAPFVSLPMFLDIFEPAWRATVAPYVEAGCHASHHNCGKLDEFIPYIVDMGFDSWNPAEPQNDLVAIKQQYAGKLAIVGGFDGNGFVCWPETTEEEVRAYVRQQVDMLAPGGSYCFGGGIMGAPDDEFAIRRREIITDEFEKIRYNYYN